jgi:hypothetical protein
MTLQKITLVGCQLHIAILPTPHQQCCIANSPSQFHLADGLQISGFFPQFCDVAEVAIIHNLAIYDTFTIAFTHSFSPFIAHSQQLQLINNLSF